MEEKNFFKINLSTLLFLITIIIVVMGCFVYKTYKNQQLSDSKTPEFGNEHLSDLDNYIFELNSKNKYTIITDMRWLTMLNDGGSNTSIYYQIDLDNNIVSKVKE